MKLALSSIFALVLLLFTSTEISMSGVKIGDSQKSLNKLKLKLEAKDGDMIKFKTGNGNDFSVTCQKGKVVFMENDWLQSPDARQTLFSGFEFGKTTLKDIRAKFGTNGFSYRSRGAFTTEEDLIEFNCFEFDSPNHEVLVMITKVSLKANLTEDNVADNLRLDAMIIADKTYLDNEWGTEKVYDPNYKKIKP